MPDTIRDGKGRGFLSGVNFDNELLTRSTSVPQRLHSAVDGLYYEATTGIINLSDANELDIIYLKYTGDKAVVVDRVFYDSWASTGGTANTGVLRYYHTITSVTGGSAATVTNTRFSSTNSLNATVTKSTAFTGGTVWWSGLFSSGGSTALEEGRILLTQNDTFGISVQADDSNSSMDVSVNIAMYEFDTNVIL